MLYHRALLTAIKKVLGREEFIVLTGARQTGKTSLMILLKEYLESDGQPCHYFNMENPDTLSHLNNHPFNLLELIPSARTKQTVFIDEVHYLNDPANFLKLLYDERREMIKIIASGSSAFYIDEKFKDSLAGRKFLFEIYPLNFNEFLVFHNEEDLLKEKRTILIKKKLMGLWNEYLVFGGYPKVVLEKDSDIKHMLLEEIGTAYIKKDIVEAGIRNTEKYFTLLKLLAEQTGGLVNSQELASTLGMTHKTVEDYLNVMKKSYQVAFIRPFYKNLRKELTKMPKAYFYDLGLRNFLLNNYSLPEKRMDKGAYLENIAFREFLAQTQSIDKIKFWRTQNKNEVDFVVGNKAFEVKFDLKNVRGKKYAQFRESYPNIPLKFLTYNDFLEHFYSTT